MGDLLIYNEPKNKVLCRNKIKNKKYHTIEIVLKPNRKITERGKIDTHNTQIHDRSLFWLVTGISIKCGGVKLVLGFQTSPLGKIMRSCKSFPHVRMKVLDYYTQQLWLIETNLFLFVYREFDDVENSRYIRFHYVLCEGALVTSCWGSLLLNSSFWWGPCCSSF